MQTIKDIIIHLKQIKQERELSLNDICDLIEQNGENLSRSSVQRVFAEGSENISFKYEETIRPIANALLDIENLEETDNLSTQSLKLILQYKSHYIKELERQIEKNKLKYHENLDKERDTYAKNIEFLKNQISLKDKRMDQLLEAVFVKDKQMNEYMNHILNCPYRKDCNN
jgi:hypothetical protein